MPRPAHADHVTPCASCGETHPKCAAHRKSDGKPCGGNPLDGHWVCRKHGGDRIEVKQAAHRNVQMAKAEKACATFGLPVQVDPYRALLEELWRTNGWVHHLHSKLVEQGEEAVSAEGKPSVTWVLYDQQRQQLQRVAESCARTGVNERLTRIMERDSEMYVLSMQAGLRALGIDPMGEQGRVFLEAGLAALPGEVAA